MSTTQAQPQATQQEKVAAVQNALFNEVYLPAFVQRYNEKAAQVGFPPIRTQGELDHALNLTAYIEMQKQAEISPLTKAAQALDHMAAEQGAPSQASHQYAQQAAQNPAVLEALKALASN